MKTRLFYTDGKENLFEEEWNKPEITDQEIEVKSIYTGVCRSDIDMYQGTFQLLPKTIQGHESLGVVTKVGRGITDVKEGDFVATRGEPAFADFYNCKFGMYVQVPEANPKYIIEPVACGINIATRIRPDVFDERPILLLGSGFLATIIYNMLHRTFDNEVIVVGAANRAFWSEMPGVTQVGAEYLTGKKFKYIIDISEKPEYLDLNIYEESATIVLAAEKHPNAVTSFGNFLWNAVNVKFPSPRNAYFINAMGLAVQLIKAGDLDTASMWTKAYDRETEIKLAFKEGIERPAGYSRGYIEWKR
jgi:NADPH:quinone reductase-like Zn-dependent oxidoreductase